MGVGNSGFQGTVKVDKSSSISTRTDGNALGGVQTASITPTQTPLDITSFADTGIDNIKGLQDTELTIDLVEKPDDTAQTDIEEVFLDRELVYVAFFPSSTSFGFTSQFIVSEINNDSEVDSPDTKTLTLLQSDSSGYTVLT